MPSQTTFNPKVSPEDPTPSPQPHRLQAWIASDQTGKTKLSACAKPVGREEWVRRPPDSAILGKPHGVEPSHYWPRRRLVPMSNQIMDAKRAKIDMLKPIDSATRLIVATSFDIFCWRAVCFSN